MTKHSSARAIVLNLDGLNANMLGPYGGTLVETENFNRLAGEAFLFDQHLASHTQLGPSYNSPNSLWGLEGSVIHSLTQSGRGCTLVTDAAELAEMAIHWEHCHALSVEPATELATDISHTELARFFAQASAVLEQADTSELVWLHSRGLWGDWDAPYAVREHLASSEDPEPPQFVQPPVFTPAQELDPDVQLGVQQAWAAQLTLMDQFLGVLLDLIDSSPHADNTLFCLTSSRGFPLGEHGFVGGDEACLFNETIHTPLLVRLPQTETFLDFRCVRSAYLVQGLLPICVTRWLESPDKLLAFLSPYAETLPDPHQQLAISQSAHGQAIQTSAWKMIHQGNDSSLYVKPDDLWEVNDVSRRCGPIAMELETLLEEVSQNENDAPIQVSDVLALGLD